MNECGTFSHYMQRAAVIAANSVWGNKRTPSHKDFEEMLKTRTSCKYMFTYSRVNAFIA